jgi:hypothetical protein
MADTKISALPAATTPLAGTEVLPIVQSGVTEKVAVDDLTVKNIRSNATNGILQIVGPAAAATRVMTTPDANFTAARTDAAQSLTGDQTLSTGNLIIGTSGKGIDFSATSGTGTSELLADYEEGTWTPQLRFSGATTGIAYTTQTGRYTKVGRLVSAQCRILLSSKGSAAGSAEIYGLPFTVGFSGPANIYASALTFTGAFNIRVEATTDRFAMQQVSVLGAVSYLSDANFSNTTSIELSVSYTV